jgi:hypothetical protein
VAQVLNQITGNKFKMILKQYKTYINHAIICLVILCYSTPLFCQIDKLSIPFKSYAEQHLQEKIFVHTDKENYVTGEISWFKIYITDAHLNRPLDLSKVAYVELVNESHKPVFQAKIDLKNAMGSGSFLLPYSLQSGIYSFRCYTSLMKNNLSDYFFEKRLIIINPLKKPDWQESRATKYDVQFFPEGGNLVSGIESKIGFKISDQNGKSVDAKGFLQDGDNRQILTFETSKFGMGQFIFKPENGKKYKAKILVAGNVTTVDLPEIYLHGIVMTLSEDNRNKILIDVVANQSIQSINLLIHTKQVLKKIVHQEFINGRFHFEISKNEIGEGISQFTLFDEDNKPLCERLFFKKPINVLNIISQTDAKNYGKRQKVDLSVYTNQSQKPLAANLSMSVYLIDSLQGAPESNILSYLWLQSDLKGEIETPQYYFSDLPDVKIVTENLLLTQGWRRFQWDSVFSNKNISDKCIPEFNGHIIQVKVSTKANRQPVEGVPVYLSIPGERPLFYQGISNQNGFVIFNVVSFFGANQLILQAGKLQDSLRIDLVDPFSSAFTYHHQPPFELEVSKVEILKAHSLQAQVANVYYTDQQLKFIHPDSIDTLMFYGKPTRRYFLDEYTRFITMEEVLREYVEGIRLRKNNEKFSLQLANENYQNYFETEPLILLDGVTIFDVNQLIALDPLKIKKLEILNRQFFQNSILSNGILSCNTYQGDLAGYSLDPNAIVIAYEGLQLKREFYHPLYNEKEYLKSRLPDFRNVLTWMPDITIDSSGRQKISFYSSDIAGKYLIIVNGIGTDASIGFTRQYFEVN